MCMERNGVKDLQSSFHSLMAIELIIWIAEKTSDSLGSCSLFCRRGYAILFGDLWIFVSDKDISSVLRGGVCPFDGLNPRKMSDN